jgi:(S)-2-hydroxy-acid oxidase
MEPVTVAEIKEIAKSKLPAHVWDYYITGADEETTKRRNEDVYSEYV